MKIIPANPRCLQEQLKTIEKLRYSNTNFDFERGFKNIHYTGVELRLVEFEYDTPRQSTKMASN